MVVCKPILSCKDEVKVSTLSTDDIITHAWEVDDTALFSGAFICNEIKNGIEVIGGQYVHIRKVLTNAPATVIFWSDGTKTVSRCAEEDTFNPEMGFTICVLKKLMGTQNVKTLLNQWCPHEPCSITNEDYVFHKNVTLADVRKKYKE